jgi:uncharacterized protein YbcI
MPHSTSSVVARQAQSIRALSAATTATTATIFDHGPESIRTVIQKGYVISFLEGIYTPLERTLIDADRRELVMEARLAYQQVRREEFSSVVHEATGRTVRAFLSQNHVDPGIAVEIFVLEHEDGERSGVSEGASP